jgi:hypothetical protein
MLQRMSDTAVLTVVSALYAIAVFVLKRRRDSPHDQRTTQPGATKRQPRFGVPGTAPGAVR